MVRIAVVGATGYTAKELLRMLSSHPHAEVTLVTSRSQAGTPISQVHPALASRYDLVIENADAKTIARKSDFAFCCLPHAASAELVCQLPETFKVVDFSADYRLNDLLSYEKIYDTQHPQPDRVGKVVYGLPELFRDEIARATLVANPGCFPTSAILPLVPLVRSGMIENTGIVIDSKTGISGAGRNPSQKFHFPEANESTMAYSIGRHRHQPEIEQLIERATGKKTSVVFTPHVVPMNQGILSTIYLRPQQGVSAESVREAWRQAYGNEPFIRIVDEAPSTAQVAHSNFCDLWCGQNGKHLIVVAAIDNLIKGASGAALQNFNLMNGFDETLGLN